MHDAGLGSVDSQAIKVQIALPSTGTVLPIHLALGLSTSAFLIIQPHPSQTSGELQTVVLLYERNTIT